MTGEQEADQLGAKSHIHRIDIKDVFAPSFAEVGAPDKEELKSPRTRMILHNTHIVSQILPNSLKAAHQLGCPPVLPNLSLASAQESNEFLELALSEAGAISEFYEESTIEWLCLKIYAHFVHVSSVLKQSDPPLASLTDYTIVMGATCRELELAIMHRKTVEDRKRTNDRLAFNNEGRSAKNQERKQEAARKIAHAQGILAGVSTSNLSNSSLARLVIDRWEVGNDEDGFPHPPSKGTVENWLSQKKLSRTHPSE